MMTKNRLDENELKKVTGGTGSGCTIKAVGNPTKVTCKQEKCTKCGGTALTDGLFSTDNGRTVYQGQECTCGNVMIYGENIM